MLQNHAQEISACFQGDGINLISALDNTDALDHTQNPILKLKKKYGFIKTKIRFLITSITY